MDLAFDAQCVKNPVLLIKKSSYALFSVLAYIVWFICLPTRQMHYQPCLCTWITLFRVIHALQCERSFLQAPKKKRKLHSTHTYKNNSNCHLNVHLLTGRWLKEITNRRLVDCFSLKTCLNMIFKFLVSVTHSFILRGWTIFQVLMDTFIKKLKMELFYR